MARSLSRKKDYRNLLLRNLVTSLVLYEEIKTTEAKAKEVRPIFEHLITMAKKNDLASRRHLQGYLLDKKAVKKVLEILLPRFKNIPSGYISLLKIGPRLGDAAPMVIIKLKEGKPLKVEIKENNGQKSLKRKT